MTIRELLVQHPALFYPQAWYLEEAFVDAPMLEGWPAYPPAEMQYRGIPPEVILWDFCDQPPAVVLCNQYVAYPRHPAWNGYIWTADKDAQGQRVYVGSNGRGLEIHRHLHITNRWGVPRW
jgi:hypothetical protein